MAFASFSDSPNIFFTRLSEGRDSVVHPLAVEFEVKQGVLFDILFKESKVGEQIEDIKNRKYEGAEDTEFSRRRLAELKEDIDNSTIKITVKVELQRYVG